MSLSIDPRVGQRVRPSDLDKVSTRIVEDRIISGLTTSVLGTAVTIAAGKILWKGRYVDVPELTRNQSTGTTYAHVRRSTNSNEETTGVTWVYESSSSSDDDNLAVFSIANVGGTVTVTDILPREPYLINNNGHKVIGLRGEASADSYLEMFSKAVASNEVDFEVRIVSGGAGHAGLKFIPQGDGAVYGHLMPIAIDMSDDTSEISTGNGIRHWEFDDDYEIIKVVVHALTLPSGTATIRINKNGTEWQTMSLTSASTNNKNEYYPSGDAQSMDANDQLTFDITATDTTVRGISVKIYGYLKSFE